MDTTIIFVTVMLFTWWILGRILPKKKTVVQNVQVNTTQQQAISKLISDADTLKSFIKILAEVKDERDAAASPEAEDDKILRETIQEVMNEMPVIKVNDDIKPSGNKINDATVALKKLGYKQTDIKRAIDIIAKSEGNISVDYIVRKALTILNN
jgi:hypothetical protein